jgi:DNA mismatch endonuclease (patch repair protein)
MPGRNLFIIQPVTCRFMLAIDARLDSLHRRRPCDRCRPKRLAICFWSQKGTTPELAVRTILTDLGVEYSTNVTDLPGSPDIVAAEAKRAVFVHGCFWHRHARCPACTTPKRNAAFWNNKFEQNTARDAKKMRQLRRIGFRILKVWECQLKREDKIARLTERLAKFFAVGI